MEPSITQEIINIDGGSKNLREWSNVLLSHFIHRITKPMRPPGNTGTMQFVNPLDA